MLSMTTCVKSSVIERRALSACPLSPKKNEHTAPTCSSRILAAALALLRGCVVVLAHVQPQGGCALRAVFVRVDLVAEAARDHTLHQVARVAHRNPAKPLPHVADGAAAAATLKLGDHGVAAQQHFLYVQLALVVHARAARRVNFGQIRNRVQSTGRLLSSHSTCNIKVGAGVGR